MKIIFDNIIYSLQRSGGGSVYWTELIKRFNNTNEEITFIDHEDLKDNIFRRDLKLNNIQKENKIPFLLRRYCPFTKKVEKPTIFHSSYYRVSKSPNAINVTSVHDFTTEYFRKGLPKWLHFFQKKYAIQNSAGIICISENTKKDLLKFHPKTDPKKIRVIYNGISEDFFRIKQHFLLEDIDEKYKVFQDKKLLLFIGHRTNYKNFDKAVKAFSALKDNSYHFVIIGEKLSNTEEQLVKLNISEDLYTVLSGINNTKLNYLYNKAFALIYPSSYEGFGIPLIEAMKTGLPVIAMHNSSIPEVAGNAGILINRLDPETINNAIKKLEKISYREEVIEKGLIQAEKFSWDKTFHDYHKFYQELYDAAI